MSSLSLLFYYNTFLRFDESALLSLTQFICCSQAYAAQFETVCSHFVQIGADPLLLVKADSCVVLHPDVIIVSPFLFCSMLMVVLCSSGAFHWSGSEAEVPWVFVSVRWCCPLVRRWTVCVKAARIRYRIVWVCCGLKKAGLSLGLEEWRMLDWRDAL